MPLVTWLLPRFSAPAVSAAGQHAGEDLAHEGQAGAPVLAKGADGALAVAGAKQLAGEHRAVQRGGVGGEVPVGAD
jgi:hypothetical protein